MHPAIAVVRTWTFAPGGDVNNNGLVDAGDQIVYSYAVHNTGNVTLADVNVNDIHDGTGAALAFVTPTSVTTDNGSAGAGTLNDSSDVGATADGDWDVLGPDDFITFTSQPYIVVAGDLTAPTSADGDIDGTVTATGNYNPGTGNTTVTGTGSAPVPLNQVPSLEVSKVASQDTNVPAGTVITYTYRCAQHRHGAAHQRDPERYPQGCCGCLDPDLRKLGHQHWLHQHRQHHQHAGTRRRGGIHRHLHRHPGPTWIRCSNGPEARLT